MNKQCYRVIFNKARGMLMVVSEAARSQGKTSNAGEGGSDISQVAGTAQINSQTAGHTSAFTSDSSCYQSGKLITLRSHLLLALGLATIVATTAHADATNIVADRNAAANNQAVIINTSSGKTQVNIQTPSAAGVSRNVFSKFDVGADGAILNNSRVNAQTQLAGWVEGNPYLARGEARVILNEVNSSDPSRLTGFTEIAGGRAELIIANPAGITCAGCGFINAARTTLTTGEALMDQGRLTGFDIKEGNIRIDGDGLDSSTSDYTQILSKTADINAAIYAKNLDVITGNNTVSYETNGADSIITSSNSQSNQATGVALDVSALGAMYAGKIRLIGTQKGMGVTNAGSIIASTGNLQLDNNGNLINTGSLIANKGAIDINVGNATIDNSGTIASSRDTVAFSSSALDNSGVINSYDTASLQQTGSITNSGEIAAGSFDLTTSSLNNSGKLLQTGTGQLTVDTSSLTNSQGGIIGQDLYADASTPPATAPTTNPPTTANNGSTVQENSGTTNPSEPTPVILPPVSRDGTITVSNITNSGSIYSNSKINTTADSVNNQGKSSLALGRLDIANSGSLINTDSRVQLENIDWQLASFDNSNSQITATNSINIRTANQINNTQGTIGAIGDISLSAKNQINNNQGVIQSNANVITNSDDFNNTKGSISSQGNLSIDNRGNLINNQGRLQSDDSLTLNTKGYSNTDGTIIGVQRAAINTLDDITINNNNNNIQAGNLAITTQGIFTNTTKVAGQNALTITANRIDNQQDGELTSSGTTQLNAATDIDNRGLINGVNTYLNATDSVNNYSGGRIYGDQVAIAANTLNNTPDAGIDSSDPAPIIAARNRLDIGVATLNNNPNQARSGIFNEDFNGQARLISNGVLYIGGSLDVNQQAVGRATIVTNKGASIESVGDMTISTNLLNNVNADFKKEAFTISEVEGKEQFAAAGNDSRAYDPDRDGRKYDKEEVELRDDKKLKDEDLYVIATDEPLGSSGGENFYIFNFDERVTEDRTVTSDASRIISGGVITLQGDQLNNDKSQLGLGEGFVVTGDSFTNVGKAELQGFKTKYIENGNVIYRYVKSSGFFGGSHEIKKNNLGAYTEAAERLESYQLPILKQDIDKVVIAHNVTNTDSTAVTTNPTDEIRSSGTAPTLPNSGLFGINPDSDADYLIETDSEFANYKNWLSSSYMLERLKLDPTITQKRLGDGYYEQQYIRDQIMMLTGRYYLANYADQDAQYKGLMDAGITAAQTLNLRPGIALSAEQVANLTTDMVWLVEQNITLADGSSQQVLVPKVYTRQAVGQINGTGNLIAANNIDVNLTGDLTSQSNIIGHQSVTINANNITNANGGVIKGSFVQLGTKNDLNNLSGTIAADSAMQLDVGGDLNNKSLTYTSDAVNGASNATRTGITQIASLYIGDGLKGKTDANGNPLTTLIASVGGNTTFAAGRLDNQGGSSVINTTGDVTLDAVNVGYQSNSILDSNNFYNQGASADIGSQITGNNDILLTGNNISGTAAQISSTTGNVGILADGNVDFIEGRSTNNLSTAVKTTDSGFLSKKVTQDRLDAQNDQSITSNIEGNTVSIQAGENIGLRGTNVVTDKGVQLSAGGDIDILAAQNTSSESSSTQVKKSGLFSNGGASFTIGKQQSDDSNARTSLTNTASNVAAIDGNVIITAGGKYQQTGSNLVAGMGADSDKDISSPDRGNTVVRAKEINIDNAMDVYTNQSESKFKQSGLTVSVSNSLVDSAQSINSLVDAGGNTDSVRMKGMAGIAAALKIRGLAQKNEKGISQLGALKDGNLKQAGNTRIQATLGTQKSQSNSSSSTGINQASTITTNNLALIATGGGVDSNININSSNLDVTNNALFQADNDFNVNGVAQESNTRSTNSSSSAAIGGYASTGSGFGITANASRGKGFANSDSVTYANSQINVGGTTTYDIGNDVNIKGGVINTNRAQGTIGGNVNIESLQDTAVYDSNQKNIGFSADIDINGAGSSLSVNGGKTDINADYKAVGQQSGIFTGDGGFDLEVSGKTTLIGGAITTTDAAVAAGLNNYTSLGGIETTDIENTTSYKGDAIQVGVSLGMTENKPQANSNGLGYGTDADSDSSITKAGITGIAGNSGITTDNKAEYAGALKNVFDATRVNEELGAQVEITQAFDQERRKVKTELNTKEKDLRAESEAAFNNGDFDLAKDKLIAADKVQNQGLLFDAISGAIYGPNTNGVTGYVAKAASPFVSNQIGQYYKELGDEQGGNLTGAQQAGHILAHGILGAATSSATGNDALTGGLSAGSGEAAAPLISDFLYGTSDPSKLTAEQKDTISSITSALGAVIGATTGDTSDAANAAETSKVAVEDNNLKNKDVKELLRQIDVAKAKYKGGKLDTKMREIRALAAKMSEDNYKEIKACEKNPTEACLNRIKVDYGNVNFKELGDAYRLYPGTQATIDGYEQRNNSIVTCSGSRPTDCIYTDQFQKTLTGAVYELVGAGAVRKVIAGKTTSSVYGGNSVSQKITFNGVALDSRLPVPEAGYNYKPNVLNRPTVNQQNAHVNGFKGEIEQANRVAQIPNEQVLKWGDAIGRNGSDIISVNKQTGQVTLWDSKYRSSPTYIKVSPTFTKTSTLGNAKQEAIEAVENSKLPVDIKNKALANLDDNNFRTVTTGAGAGRNSVIK